MIALKLKHVYDGVQYQQHMFTKSLLIYSQLNIFLV